MRNFLNISYIFPYLFTKNVVEETLYLQQSTKGFFMDLMFIQLAGRIVADPETRHTPTGQKVTTIRMVVNTKRQGKETANWWRVTIFGDRFEKMMPYLKKGASIMAMGSLNPPDTYQDREGNTKVSLEMIADFITFTGSANSNGQTRQEGQGQAQNQSSGDFEVVTSMPQRQNSPAMSGAFTGGMGIPGINNQPEMNDDIPF